MQPEELMRNKADQMEMAIIVSTTRDLEDTGFEHGIGIVPHAFRRQVQGVDYCLDLMIQGP